MAKKLIDKSIPRFLLVGVGNTLLSMALMFLLEGLGNWPSTAIAYPVGIVAAALFLGIFIWRTLIVGKDDVAPLHAAKN